MAIYAKIKGKTQGDISGGVTAFGHHGEIEIHSCEIGISSPRDVASGLASGKRQWRPIHLVKTLDKSTPLLFNALFNNEVLTKVTITYWGTARDGKPAQFATVVLDNAMISDYNHLGAVDGTATEKLSLTFTKFEFTWNEGGIVAVDDWMSPA